MLTVCSKTADPEILKEKYSASFIDELKRQITEEISRAMSVEGLEESTLELQLAFEPGTFMEHTSENVTYRRLLITDKLCQPRDFWVKWTRLDGAVAYTVSDEVSSETVRFEIGEDVPQKIREKEFRFLCLTDPDKYQASMSKKTATEWRDLIKRAIKRGDLERVETVFELDNNDVNDQLARVLGVSVPSVKAEDHGTAPEFDKVMEMARAAIASYAGEEDETPVTVAEDKEEVFTFSKAAPVFDITEDEAEAEDEAPVLFEEETDEPEAEIPAFFEDADIEEDEALDEESDGEDDFAFAATDEDFVSDIGNDEDEVPFELDEPEAEEEAKEEQTSTSVEDNEDDLMGVTYNEEVAKLVEERMRAELEAKIRLEYEERARAEAEAEARKLREENERLAEAARIAIEEKERYERERREAEERERREALERERLAEAARQAEEERARHERERLEAEELRKKEEALRLEIQEQMRREAIERQRLAEAARQAEIESARLEREKQEAEERHRKEEEELRAKIEAQMQREAIERDRLAEAARQAVEEQRRRELEEAERKEAERKEAERKEAERREAERKAAAQKPKPKAPDTFTSHATITFRKTVDMGVINRIQQIVEETLIESGKQDVPMHLKAFQIDDNTVGLDIIRLPIKEKDLIVTIMKALGNGHIGISRITVE